MFTSVETQQSVAPCPSCGGLYWECYRAFPSHADYTCATPIIDWDPESPTGPRVDECIRCGATLAGRAG